MSKLNYIVMPAQDFLYKQFQLVLTILSSKSLSNFNIVFSFYSSNLIKFFYLLFLIRELCFQLVLLDNYIDNIYYKKLNLIFFEIIFFFEQQFILDLSEFFNSIKCIFFVNYYLNLLFVLYKDFGMKPFIYFGNYDFTYFSSMFDVLKGYYFGFLQSNFDLFDRYTHLNNVVITKDIITNEYVFYYNECVSSVLSYGIENNTGLSFYNYSVFFHYYLEVQLLFLFNNYIPILLPNLFLFVENFYNFSYYNKFLNIEVVPKLFRVLSNSSFNLGFETSLLPVSKEILLLDICLLWDSILNNLGNEFFKYVFCIVLFHCYHLLFYVLEITSNYFLLVKIVRRLSVILSDFYLFSSDFLSIVKINLLLDELFSIDSVLQEIYLSINLSVVDKPMFFTNNYNFKDSFVIFYKQLVLFFFRYCFELFMLKNNHVVNSDIFLVPDNYFNVFEDFSRYMLVVLNNKLLFDLEKVNITLLVYMQLLCFYFQLIVIINIFSINYDKQKYLEFYNVSNWEINKISLFEEIFKLIFIMFNYLKNIELG